MWIGHRKEIRKLTFRRANARNVNFLLLNRSIEYKDWPNICPIDQAKHRSVHNLLSSFPQRTCKPLDSRVSYPCSLSPQFDYHDQRLHSWVTLGETFQNEGVPHAGPVLHADVGFKRLFSVFEFDDRHSGARYHLHNRRQLNIALWKTLQLSLHERGSMNQLALE